MKDKILLDDALLLVEQNFYFLNVGEFFGNLSKEESFLDRNLYVKREFDSAQTYHFNKNIIENILSDAYEKNSNDMTLFEYFVEFNSFRGICMGMVEALRIESKFQQFIKFKLHGNYENFFDIISFVRNVLSHNTHAQIILNDKDYAGTLKRIRRMKRNPDITFDFNYARDLPEMDSPDLSYGFTCKVNFEELNDEMSFLNIISHFELMMISELCFNLVVVYRALIQK